MMPDLAAAELKGLKFDLRGGNGFSVPGCFDGKGKIPACVGWGSQNGDGRTEERDESPPHGVIEGKKRDEGWV